MEKKQREKLIDSIVGSLEKDIDEIYDVDEDDHVHNEELIAELEVLDGVASDEVLAEGDALPTESKNNSQVDLAPTYKRGFVSIAVIMICFTVIGVITSVGFIQNIVNDIREQRTLKEEFARFVYPVVINDPPAYDSVDNLQDSTIIASAIWNIILIGDKSNYDTEIGVIYVPAVDVESAANSIFGTGTLNHESVNLGIQFIYNSQSNTYEIPDNPILFSNSPKITEITNIGELYTVTVEYIAPSPYQVAGIEHETEPTKTMIYTISRTREKMTINSIQAAEFDTGHL